MKKAYAVPTLVANGNVVRETLNGSKLATEDVSHKPSSGADIGFYL
jgi:hypothetical protein